MELSERVNDWIFYNSVVFYVLVFFVMLVHTPIYPVFVNNSIVSQDIPLSDFDRSLIISRYEDQFDMKSRVSFISFFLYFLVLPFVNLYFIILYFLLPKHLNTLPSVSS